MTIPYLEYRYLIMAIYPSGWEGDNSLIATNSHLEEQLYETIACRFQH